jgi:enoyl-CoA hydratase/carnithine racemase
LKVNREIASILNAFAAWPVPKLALIDGDVLGGGMEWLARFDFRWASPNAYFVFWQKRIGLSTGWGGGRAWSAKIGEDRIRRLLIESQTLSAGLALREGLVDRVVTGWRMQEEAAAWAARMKDETTAGLLKWKPASEQVIFSKQWMGRAHAATLKSWKA